MLKKLTISETSLVFVLMKIHWLMESKGTVINNTPKINNKYELTYSGDAYEATHLVQKFLKADCEFLWLFANQLEGISQSVSKAKSQSLIYGKLGV